MPIFNFPYAYPQFHVGIQPNNPGETGPQGSGHGVAPRTNIRLSGTFLPAFYMREQAHAKALAPNNNAAAGMFDATIINGLQKARK